MLSWSIIVQVPRPREFPERKAMLQVSGQSRSKIWATLGGEMSIALEGYLGKVVWC